MDLTDAHRAALGRAFQDMRRRRFRDNRKDAYDEAGVNATTWGRLETGLTVKDRTLATVLSRLIPSSEGDWRRLSWTEQDGVLEVDLAPVGPDPTIELATVVADLRREVDDIQDRLKRLEGGRTSTDRTSA